MSGSVTIDRSALGKELDRAFFARDVVTVARELVGTGLFVDGAGGIIVETEAYDATDPASHSFKGRTARNASMFGPAGHAYVYRSYGLHWCLNMVCGEGLAGSAILIRAIEPTQRLDRMRTRRGLDDPKLLCAGPGRLCRALGVDADLDGAPLDAPPFMLCARSAPLEVASTTRIGIRLGAGTPWRFGVAGSRFLSRPITAPGRQELAE